MSRNRVVITGLGFITPLGDTVEATVDALWTGRSGISLIRRWDASAFPVRFGGEIADFDPARYGVDARDAKRMDRFAQFAVAAAANAVADSGVDFAKEDGDRCGVIIGTGIGGLETVQEQYRILLDRGIGRVSPFTVPKMMTNASAAQVSIRYGLRGPNTVVSTACSTGSNAIGDAGRAIQAGLADVMLAGGSEAALCELGLASFCAARALSTRNDDPTRASRPWDKDRDGFVLSEGAVVVLLEEYEHAKRRGAKIYAELAGYGVSADAFHITSPETNGAGAALAMRHALKDAALNIDAIDYVNAHGTSTEQGDLAETRGLHCVFGPHASRLMVSSVKGQAGHLLGAAGALSAAVASLAIDRNLTPATVNLETPGDGCDLDYVPQHARERRSNVVLSNSFGFGGHNTSLIFRRAD
ncbi:MAG: beta-ketoacyl-acyl-carrier-protein synthase [Phycisphaerales bacterium]|nr:beta-ketoacyl-acyl-carrier-protein synthase [Phycisphaerales bacterium]